MDCLAVAAKSAARLGRVYDPSKGAISQPWCNAAWAAPTANRSSGAHYAIAGAGPRCSSCACATLPGDRQLACRPLTQTSTVAIAKGGISTQAIALIQDRGFGAGAGPASAAPAFQLAIAADGARDGPRFKSLHCRPYAHPGADLAFCNAVATVAGSERRMLPGSSLFRSGASSSPLFRSRVKAWSRPMLAAAISAPAARRLRAVARGRRLSSLRPDPEPLALEVERKTAIKEQI